MSLISSLSTAGNMNNYLTDTQDRQQAVQLANALNALKLQQGQADLAGGGIAGNALLSSLAGQPQQQAQQMPPVLPVSGGGAPPSPGMQPDPGMKPMDPSRMAAGQIPVTGMQMNASALQPPGAMPPQPQGGPPPMPAAPGGMPPQQAPQQQQPQPQAPQQNLTWKSIAQAIKQQAPNATGQQVMSAIERLSPMMSAQNKSDWENFKLSMQSQLKEQGLQQQLQIANQKNDTNVRGQDVRAQTAGGNATPEEIQFLVDEVKAGNQSILARMPASVRLKVADAMQTGGTSGTDAANSALTYHGKQSEASKVGQQLGGLEVAGEGFKAIAPEALQASASVPRESWTSAAKLGNWLREQSNDPKFVAFQNFNLGLVREYARAMGGTVSAQNKATEALGTAKSQPAYKAAVNTLQREIDLATKGGKKALTDVTGPGSDTTIEPDGVPSNGSPDGWSIKSRGQ